MRRAARAIGDGHTLQTALRGLSHRVGVDSIARFVEGLLAAVERGTPLADTVRAQAEDARSDAHRALMEQSGRRDVAMLVPVVFLILPLVVVIALFPGAMELGLIGG